MNKDRLLEYAPELYEALKKLLEEIPVIAGDSRHDELALRIQEAAKLIREIEESQDEEKLKPCPFCGGEAVYPEGLTVGGYWITCSKCGIEQGHGYMTQEEAIAAWNRRATE